jgi:cytochrome c biogenesis protein ResB
MEVNKPLRFKDIDFYQADWKRILRIVFNQQKFDINLDQIGNKEMAFISVSKDLGLLFLISPQDQTLNLISVSGNLDTNILKKPQDLLKNNNLKLLASNLKQNDKTQIGPMKFQFIGAFSQTGIQFKYSPGDNLMIVGMCILLLGVFIAFGSKRFIWAVQDKAKNAFFIIAKSDRLPKDFAQELNNLV